MNEERESGRWQLDRRVPLAIIVAILTQTIGAVWWAATISARVDGMELRMAGMSGFASRLARQEERQAAVNMRLERIEELQRRIETKIDRLLLNRGKK